MRHLAGSLCSLGLGFSAFCHAAFAEDTPTIGGQQALLFKTSAGGEQHFAVAIRGESLKETIKRHVILVDTSASQTGIYRSNSQQIVASLIERLPSGHSVMVVAVDTTYAPITSGFVATGSEELRAALNGLKKRTPMGSTDLHGAIRKAFADQPLAPMSMLYIGDGMSASNRLSVADLDTLVDDLQKRQIAFHAVLMGPKVDSELPGILVHQTGGTIERPETLNASVTSERLAEQLTVVPVLVGNLKANGDYKLAANEQIAIRPDRDTLVFGEGAASAGFAVTGQTSNGTTLTWSANAKDIKSAGQEVHFLFDLAADTAGLNTSVVGVHGLQAAGRELESNVVEAVVAANRLQAGGKTEQAREVARQAKLLDASNPVLTTLAAGLLDETAPPATEPLQGDDTLGPPSADEGDALSKAQARADILTQQLVQSTNAAIEEAKRTASEQPEYALTLLKDVLDTIRASQEVAPEKREELERRVIDAYSRVNLARQTNELTQRERTQRRANQEQVRNVLEASQREEQRLQTLISQVRGSLERARKGDFNSFEDAEATSRTALDLKPGNGTATAALVMSEASGQLAKAYRLVNLRHDRFLETLYQVELSHVPFPDEPPVQYPPAAVWRNLTLTRSEKYKAVSILVTSEAEEKVKLKIGKLLDEPVPPLDFAEGTPLRDIFDAIETHFDTLGEPFKIILDESDPDIGEDPNYLTETTVSEVNLKGITLRSALKLILAKVKDQELTYIIDDEVMKITTIATAELPETLELRLYDVTHLVIPVISLAQLGGGGGQGGGQGGGGLGGQGGGGFGGGGGGLGGGGGGLGGGQFSIPSETLKPVDGIQLKGADVKKKPVK